MKCPSCGTENNDHNRYCKNCGITLTQKETAQEAKKVKVEYEEPPKNNNNNKKNDNGSLWACCICVVFLFIIFAIFAH